MNWIVETKKVDILCDDTCVMNSALYFFVPLRTKELHQLTLIYRTMTVKNKL